VDSKLGGNNLRAAAYCQSSDVTILPEGFMDGKANTVMYHF
jgi:hypothetical protein